MSKLWDRRGRENDKKAIDLHKFVGWIYSINYLQLYMSNNWFRMIWVFVPGCWICKSQDVVRRTRDRHEKYRQKVNKYKHYRKSEATKCEKIWEGDLSRIQKCVHKNVSSSCEICCWWRRINTNKRGTNREAWQKSI